MSLIPPFGGTVSSGYDTNRQSGAHEGSYGQMRNMWRFWTLESSVLRSGVEFLLYRGEVESPFGEEDKQVVDEVGGL